MDANFSMSSEELKELVGWDENISGFDKKTFVKIIRRLSQEYSELEALIDPKVIRKCPDCGHYYKDACDCFKHPTKGYIRPRDLPAGTPVYIVEYDEGNNFCVKGMNASEGDFFIAERNSKLKTLAFIEKTGNLFLVD